MIKWILGGAGVAVLAFEPVKTFVATTLVGKVPYLTQSSVPFIGIALIVLALFMKE